MLRRSMIVMFSGTTLAGCATLGIPEAKVVQAAKDASALAKGLAGAVAQIVGINLPPVIATSLAGVQAAADALAGAYTTAEAQPIVQKLVTYALALLDALSKVPGLPPVVLIGITAAQVLLPIIQQAVGIFVASGPAAPAMTPDQARAELIRLGAYVP